MIFTIELFICAGIFGFDGISATMNYEAELITHLLRNYSSQARPVKNISDTIVVKLGLELAQIVSVRERDQKITYKIWFRMSWTNELMTWNTSEWGGVTMANIAPGLVWVPDIVIYDEVSSDMYKSTTRYKMRIQMDSSGKHTWNVPMIITCGCQINVLHFPFDSQTCGIKFSSWSYDTSKLTLVKDERPIVTAGYKESSEWNLKSAKSELQVIKYDCCPIPYINTLFTISIKRKPLYYIYTAICPCIILIIIILFSFLLPSDCIERLSTIVTMLLAIVVFLQLISDTLPRNSDSTSKLSIFYIALMVESTISLIMTCGVIFVYRKGSEKSTKPLPKWLRKTFLQIPDKTSQLKDKIQGSFRRQVPVNVVGTEERENNCQPRNIKNLKADGNYGNPGYPNSASPGMYLGNDIISHQLKSDRQKRSEPEEIEEEWQLFATMLDRLFLVIMVIVFGITILFLFI